MFQLAETAAERNATVRLELPYGAAVAPDARDVTVALPRTGSNVSYTFTVRAQAGTQAEEYTVTFIVAPSNNFNWTALVVPAPGESAVTLTHASAESAWRFLLPVSAAFQSASLALTLPYGAALSPADWAAQLPLPLPLPLGDGQRTQLHVPRDGAERRGRPSRHAAVRRGAVC